MSYGCWTNWVIMGAICSVSFTTLAGSSSVEFLSRLWLGVHLFSFFHDSGWEFICSVSFTTLAGSSSNQFIS